MTKLRCAHPVWTELAAVKAHRGSKDVHRGVVDRSARPGSARGRLSPWVRLFAVGMVSLLSACGDDAGAQLRKREPEFAAAASQVAALPPGTFGGYGGCQPNSGDLGLDGYGTFDAICAWPANPDFPTSFVAFRIYQPTKSPRGRGIIRSMSDDQPLPPSTCIKHLFGRWWRYESGRDVPWCAKGYHAIGGG